MLCVLASLICSGLRFQVCLCNGLTARADFRLSLHFPEVLSTDLVGYDPGLFSPQLPIQDCRKAGEIRNGKMKGKGPTL